MNRARYIFYRDVLWYLMLRPLLTIAALLAAGWALLHFYGCGYVTTPTGTDPPEDVAAWHALAVQDVGCYVAKPASWDRFNFVRMPEPFNCADQVGTAGCFRPGPLDTRYMGTIYWHDGEPYVVRHELQHALMYAGGDPRWHTIGHPGGTLPCD